ncbi:MAG: ribonuclease Z [Chloroflexi bacterium]|nr:ribonuclease Z [Chloroflexota bacterium]MCC6893974.1 ribonuclease Z [Anaerolineae bacterium]
MFEIVFLGTSASAPSIHRGLPAQIILAGEHRFLVDCGEGTQRQILRSGVGFKRLNRILLTHSHLDHILGLGGLVSTFASWEEMSELEIWGGKPTLDRVQKLLYGVVLDYERIPIQIHLIDIKAGKLMQAKDFTVSAFPVTHRGQGNFGFIFQEKSHRPFLLDKAEALGIPAGPERAALVKGEAITLKDGRIIQPDMVLGELIRGSKLVYIGDTSRTDNVTEYVKDADALAIEATFLHENVEEARAFGHITAREAAALALENGVKTLLLTHVSRRYRERDIVDEARRVFPNTYVVRDFDHFTLRRDQPVEKKVAQHQEDDDK